jgi:DNA/RNA-binding domain of Phe-tRNA-synthetase-like protein
LSVYDFKQLDFPLEISTGNNNENYTAIAKPDLNLENLIIARNTMEMFGSSTSDSQRMMVSGRTEKVLLIIYGFVNGL